MVLGGIGKELLGRTYAAAEGAEPWLPKVIVFIVPLAVRTLVTARNNGNYRTDLIEECQDQAFPHLNLGAE